MPQGKVVFAGLNQTGVIVLVICAVIPALWCFIWIPWVVDSMKGDPNFSE